MPSYRTREYGGSISFGFKVAAILALFGVMACLWWAVPRTRPDTRDMQARTARLGHGIYSALKEMKDPPGDPDGAWQRLAEVIVCSNCQGSGKVVGEEGGEVPCPVCMGLGVNLKQGTALAMRRALLDLVPCKACKGLGEINRKRCKVCGGAGHLPKEVEKVREDLAAGRLVDAWNHRFKITIEPAEKGIKFEVRSAGPDGRFSTRGKGDDIIAADDMD